MPDRQRILILELWGLGDAIIMSAFLRSIPIEKVSVTVLCKAASAELLRPSYPEVEFIAFHAPWTAFHGKYRIWNWPICKIFSLLLVLRRRGFDMAVSVRPDPRDALWMWLVGVRQSFGFPRAGGGVLLSRTGQRDAKRHKVEDWWHLANQMFPGETRHHPPHLATSSPSIPRPDVWGKRDARPLWVIHCGAGQAIRRWPETYFRDLLTSLRKEFDFQLGIILDHDEAGENLADIADLQLKPDSITQLIQALEAADLLFANDSGPGHIMAALGKPVVSIFGSQNPDWFRPYGDRVQVVKLLPSPCPPCFDGGGELERRCLTELTPVLAFAIVRPFLSRLFPSSLK